MNQRRDYDSTVARIAGNIASGWGECTDSQTEDQYLDEVARISVKLARAIVGWTKRTEPAVPSGAPTP